MSYYLGCVAKCFFYFLKPAAEALYNKLSIVFEVLCVVFFTKTLWKLMKINKCFIMKLI